MRKSERDQSPFVHQWLRSAIPDSQQPTSPIGFLFLKLPPPPCAVLLVYIHYHKILYIHYIFSIIYVCMYIVIYDIYSGIQPLVYVILIVRSTVTLSTFLSCPGSFLSPVWIASWGSTSLPRSMPNWEKHAGTCYHFEKHRWAIQKNEMHILFKYFSSDIIRNLVWNIWNHKVVNTFCHSLRWVGSSSNVVKKQIIISK